MIRTHPPDEANLFNNLNGLSVAYINHEGVELPLKNIKDFDEAIKLAKWDGRDYLDLIFYDGQIKSNEITALNINKSAIIGRFLKNEGVTKPVKNTLFNDLCQCFEDPLPLWFKQYMKKFKKELVKDLRTSISEIVHEEFEKEKKMAEGILYKPLPEKNEFLSPNKLKRKKKISDKDAFDLLEKREMKLLRKIEKLHSSKFDRIFPVLNLEKLESKANVLFDERKKILDKGRQNKSKDAKKTWEYQRKYMKSEKSALFHENDVFLILKPGEEFSVTVNILNNGTVPWKSPRMECFNSFAFYLKEHLINLPRLEPCQSVKVTLRGKAIQKLGRYCFSYKLFDGLEEFGPQFSCFAIVSESKENIPNSEEWINHCKATPTGSLVDSLIDFEKDVIESSQKKIKENIIEIEKRLQDINLLRPAPSRNNYREAKLEINSGEFLLQDKREKFWERKLAKGVEEMYSGTCPSQQKKENEKSEQKDVNIKNENFQTVENGVESESESDLSIIFMSEEDENFILVPLLAETQKFSDIDLKKESNNLNLKPNDVFEERPLKTEPREVGSEEVSTAEDCLTSQSSPCANANQTDEEIFSKRTNPVFESYTVPSNAELVGGTSDKISEENVPGNVIYRIFDKTNLTSETSSSKYAKTGEKINNQSASHNGLSSTQEFYLQQDLKKKSTTQNNSFNSNMPTSDCLGRPIYAVRNDGYCLPVKDLIGKKAEVLGAEEKEKTQNEMEGETSSSSKEIVTEDLAVNIVPNALMSGASSGAHMAFNTAKCFINNLQSALKPEVEKMPTNHEQDSELINNFSNNIHTMDAEEQSYLKLQNHEKFINALLTLHDMGFVNLDLNFYLLTKHQGELNSIINEILDMALEVEPQAN